MIDHCTIGTILFVFMEASLFCACLLGFFARSILKSSKVMSWHFAGLRHIFLDQYQEEADNSIWPANGFLLSCSGAKVLVYSFSSTVISLQKLKGSPPSFLFLLFVVSSTTPMGRSIVTSTKLSFAQDCCQMRFMAF